MVDTTRPAAAEPVAEVRPLTPLQEFWRHFSENRGAVIGLVVVSVIAIVAILAPLISPHSPIEQYRDATKVPPIFFEGGRWEFILGTDAVGRDMLSRLMHGARASLFIGLSVMLVSTIVGVALGMFAAYGRGVLGKSPGLVGVIGNGIDAVISRVMDLIVSIPSLVLAILIIAIIGPNLTNTIIAVTVVYLPRYVRLLRASALSEFEKEYVVASRMTGAGAFRIMFLTVLPNCLAPLIVQAALGISDAILEAAGLGFLGLGAQPPVAEWGSMLGDSKEFIQSYSWIMALPGLAILVTVLSINLMGDGLRDALDPKLKRS